MKQRILKYLCIIIISAFALETSGQVKPDTLQNNRVRGIQYETATNEKASVTTLPVFVGLSVSVDLAGAMMAQVASYGQYEAALRLNFKETFFPVFELGIGNTNHTDETTLQHYKVHSPYWKVGCDYNFVKNKLSSNRLYGGLRYGFSSYKYNLDGPNIEDPVFGGEVPYHFESLSANAHWLELVGGLETRIWKFLRLGWSVRYRKMIKQKNATSGKSWYVPGYGKNNDNNWGGTFNLIFEIGRHGKK